MNHREEAKITRDNGLCTFLGDNAAAYAGDVAFGTIATKTIADYALTKIAAAADAADNKGYSLDKLVLKEKAGVLACQLCASSQVKLDSIGNYIVSKSLNATVTFYTKASDAKAASRLQNVHDVMSNNLTDITADYLTAAELVELQTEINSYTSASGTTTSVNTTSPVVTKALKNAITTGSTDVVSIKKLAKKYMKTNPTFYNNLLKTCKIPPITVRHTPVVITVTNATTGTPLENVKGTLSKTKELGTSNPAGIINYTNVSAGAAISTYKLEGFITGVQNLKIARGKTNTFNFALVLGIMTAEMDAEVLAKVEAFILAEETKKAARVAKEKVRKAAKAAKASA